MALRNFEPPDLQSTIDSSSLTPLLADLKEANDAFSAQFGGQPICQPPVHTVYGGANLYKPGAAAKLGNLAVKHMARFAPDVHQFAANLGLDADDGLVSKIYDRVNRKLAEQPVEDHRVDFEDGYGTRSDEEEDQHAKLAAEAMAAGLADGSLPASVGIRIKAFSEEAKIRSLRTLDLFISSLAVAAEGAFPPIFFVTLPKVTSAAQVKVLRAAIDLLESRIGIEAGTIRIELMLENVQVLFNSSGHFGLRDLAAAGEGRVATLVLGTFDYTASANVAASFQSHHHAAADFARQMMIAGLMDSGVNLCDGITNIMPIPPHKGSDLTDAKIFENQNVVAAAWKLHFDNIIHSMVLGIYQGWDLNPAQLPIRFAAVFYFYLTGLADAQARLKTFVGKAAQASLTGNTFDDAATGQGLVNFFKNGFRCGALDEQEVLESGVSLDEIERGSFVEIVEKRLKEGEK